MGKVAFSVRLAVLVLATSALVVGPAAAAATLSLAPGSGSPGSTFDAAYAFTPPAGARCPAGGTVDFWWDAEGPGSPPPGAGPLGQAALLAFNCTARSALQVPAAAPCGAHTVFAFIDDGRGGPTSGTTSSTGFIVAGCPTPPPAPTATPAAPSASPPEAPPGSSVLPTASASANAVPSPTPITKPFSSPAGSPAPSLHAAFPALGAPPTFPQEASSTDVSRILALLGAGALLGGWAATYFGKVKLTTASPAVAKTIKWGSLGLALLLTGGAVASAGPKMGTILSLSVPNAQFPTIQSAIDVAPAGANIHIKPGVYHETLFVRKQLQIYGSEENDGVILAGPQLGDVTVLNDAVGILNYEGKGGGWLQHVRFEGGHAGVMGVAGDPSAILEINDVEVSGSSMGILWDSGTKLTLQHSTIHGSTSNAFVNLKGHPAFSQFGVDFKGGIGLYIANATAHLSDVDVGTLDPADNGSVGIYIRESAVEIDGGLLYGNNIAGIWAVDSTLSVDTASLWANHVDPATGKFGDGIAVLLGSAELKGVLSTNNERCGISSFGATLSVTDDGFVANLFPVCGETLSPSKLSPGLPAVEMTFEYVDGGGNYCATAEAEVVCQVTSPGLEPPEPIPPSG